MCGRFALYSSPTEILNHFQIQGDLNLYVPRYNIAPSQSIWVIRQLTDQAPELVPMHWGFVPHWADEPKIKPINARAEDIEHKPMFKNAFKHRRCLIIANGFYEWQKRKEDKQPYHLKVKNQPLFAMAGIWETWHEELESTAILTTTATPSIRKIHGRMPVIVSPNFYHAWLNPQTKNLNQLLTQICQTPIKWESYPVSKQINTPKHDTPDCIAPLL